MGIELHSDLHQYKGGERRICISTHGLISVGITLSNSDVPFNVLFCNGVCMCCACTNKGQRLRIN